VPAVGTSSVASMRRVVVPAPLGPSRPTISPAATSSSMPRTASTTAWRDSKVRASPRAWIILALGSSIASARSSRDGPASIAATWS
jgi:hypothetical protein